MLSFTVALCWKLPNKCSPLLRLNPMTMLAGYLFFSLCSLYSLYFFLTSCDEYAAQLMDVPMSNSNVTNLVAFQVHNNTTPQAPVVVEINGRFEVRCTDGRIIKCHNLATARAVRAHENIAASRELDAACDEFDRLCEATDEDTRLALLSLDC